MGKNLPHLAVLPGVWAQLLPRLDGARVRDAAFTCRRKDVVLRHVDGKDGRILHKADGQLAAHKRAFGPFNLRAQQMEQRFAKLALRAAHREARQIPRPFHIVPQQPLHAVK